MAQGSDIFGSGLANQTTYTTSVPITTVRSWELEQTTEQSLDKNDTKSSQKSPKGLFADDYIYNREFKIAIYRANIKPLRHNTAHDPSTFHVAVAVCRSRLYV